MFARSGNAPDPPSLRAAYEAENVEICARGGRVVCWVSIAVIPPFLAIDLARFPEQADALLVLRLLDLLLLGGALGLSYTAWGSGRPRGLILVLSSLGGLLTLAMMSLTGGLASPYFAGIGLIMLATSLMMPWPPVWTWALCAVLTAMYVVYALAFETLGDGTLFVNALLSYAATAMIAGVATVGRERLRRREFASRQALRDSEARLREEANTSAALAFAGHELIASVETPRLLDHLCEVTTRLLGCDSSHTILWDEERGVWRAIAQDGDSPEQWALLQGVEIAPESAAPILERFRNEPVLRMQMAGEDAVSRVATSAGIARSIWLPLRLGDQIIGILTAALRDPTAAFTDQQERIATGIAHLASMALANARLHGELERQAKAERWARSAAEAANRTKDEFLAMLSHELRTPLNVILGFSEIARDRGTGARERSEALDRVQTAGRLLLEMINDILEMTRLQTDPLETPIEEIRVGDLWRALQARCSELPRVQGVTLRFGDAPDLVLKTDRRKLFVILRNLVGNALKFTDRGWVEVTVAPAEDALCFRVADTGIGIPEEAHERIFEMFRQLDGSDTRQHGGLGLGLHIVSRCAEQLGASVSVESRVGEGSVFTLGLPLAVVQGLRQDAA